MDVTKVQVRVPTAAEAGDDPLLKALIKEKGRIYPAIKSVGGSYGPIYYGFGVDLQNTKISDDGMRALEGESRLVELTLGPQMTEAALRHLHGLYLLQRLNVRNMRFTGDGLKYLGRMRDLVVLSLYECQFTDEAMSHLPLLPVLTDLYLNSTNVSDEALRFLEKLPRLERLNISRGKLTGSGLKFLEPLRRLKNLELSQTPITDEVLRNLPVLESLESIDLSNTEVGDHGLLHLQKLPRLARLQLDSSGVTDAGMGHLAGYPSLKQVQVNHAAITAAGINMIKQRLPECAISAKGSTAVKIKDERLELIARPKARQPAMVVDSWRRIEKWLAKHVPDILAALRPPATKANLRQIEKAIANSLPDDVRESYLIHDGQTSQSNDNHYVPGVLFGIGLLPLLEGEGVEWCWQNRVAHNPENFNEDDPEIRREYQSFPPGTIRLARMRPGWIPLYWDSGRDFFGIDLDPGPKGTKGQVIPFSYGYEIGAERKYVLAPSWAHFLEDVADEFEAGHAGLLPREMEDNWFYLKGAPSRNFWNAFPEWSKSKLPQLLQKNAFR